MLYTLLYTGHLRLLPLGGLHYFWREAGGGLPGVLGLFQSAREATLLRLLRV